MEAATKCIDPLGYYCRVSRNVCQNGFFNTQQNNMYAFIYRRRHKVSPVLVFLLFCQLLKLQLNGIIVLCSRANGELNIMQRHFVWQTGSGLYIQKIYYIHSQTHTSIYGRVKQKTGDIHLSAESENEIKSLRFQVKENAICMMSDLVRSGIGTHPTDIGMVDVDDDRGGSGGCTWQRHSLSSSCEWSASDAPSHSNDCNYDVSLWSVKCSMSFLRWKSHSMKRRLMSRCRKLYRINEYLLCERQNQNTHTTWYLDQWRPILLAINYVVGLDCDAKHIDDNYKLHLRALATIRTDLAAFQNMNNLKTVCTICHHMRCAGIFVSSFCIWHKTIMLLKKIFRLFPLRFVFLRVTQRSFCVACLYLRIWFSRLNWSGFSSSLLCLADWDGIPRQKHCFAKINIKNKKVRYNNIEQQRKKYMENRFMEPIINGAGRSNANYAVPPKQFSLEWCLFTILDVKTFNSIGYGQFINGLWERIDAI